MDLEVFGRHALLFDDDTMASFVNSTDALVEWNSLSIDRYDVRHLLSSPPPPRSRHRHKHHDSLESELDHDRYLDLTFPSLPQDLDTEAVQEIAGVYNAVSFTYGNQHTDQKNADTESGFCPSFPVPEHLVPNLPPTEKVHQIIARTAIFVSKHGGQSEIVLRVKQGDNPSFGFLMPDHYLHPYFRFLVDHEELLKSVIDRKSIEEENRVENVLDQSAVLKKDPKEAVNADTVIISHGSEEGGSSLNLSGKGKASSKHPVAPSKEKAHLVRRNRSISAVQAGTTTRVRKEGDSLDMVSSAVDKLQASDSSSLSILEPPSDLKRVVEKIVEFILRNGKEFEAVLVQQDTKHGRFPFLLPSNQYHPFYLNALHKAQESRPSGTGFISEKLDSSAHGMGKKTVLEKSDALSMSDIPYDCNRKEKFKMVIGKSKKDGQDPPSKATPPQVGVSVDAAAAILQAATKGVKNPRLEILSKTSINGIIQGPNTESGRSMRAIAQTAAIAAACEADSSEASLTKEQKLKAERLKRAKISQTVNLAGFEREGSSCQLDVNISGKVEKSEKKELADGHNERRLKRRYRSRSKREEGEEGEVEEIRDQKLGRKRQSHYSSHKSSNRRKQKRENTSSMDKDYQHRHNHNRISDDEHDHAQVTINMAVSIVSLESHPRHSQHRHKHDYSSDDEHKHSRHGHELDISSEDKRKHSRHKRKHTSFLDDEHKHSRHRSKGGNSSNEHYEHKRCRSSDDEDRHQSKSVKHVKKSLMEREADLEEGEILTKSDQSKASEGRDGASREASVDLSKPYNDVRSSSRPSETTEVSDDLRAKIRAMLMATL
ncbi:SPLICING FACTOR SUPPRESSOR OF WHITE-APRICOT-like protein [Salix purpurea]|uniref:SPLICING FACTOR SUPPRESSOR OF WHITE-APRICOT-like protein n=1 Tax=Salix purpurea TaxID=77065 RepID=A0A9Q0VT10_SALPP|nr:SPLICING FACTOR SUPPRESSOR OF WHITE-APRICOT-like protein [Salix purpurea]